MSDPVRPFGSRESNPAAPCRVTSACERFSAQTLACCTLACVSPSARVLPACTGRLDCVVRGSRRRAWVWVARNQCTVCATCPCVYTPNTHTQTHTHAPCKRVFLSCVRMCVCGGFQYAFVADVCVCVYVSICFCVECGMELLGSIFLARTSVCFWRVAGGWPREVRGCADRPVW